MDDGLSIEENGKVVEGRKYHPNALKDVKKKLSVISKRISELHHQRKFAYKNSVKVKKMIHYQVNQIVKCLRARERSLWSDVDEFYLSQDATISEELSKLQSVHAHCKALFNHMDDFKGNRNTFSNIHSLLSEINFERPERKSLEFISEFEILKARANNYGQLEGDFSKKDDFVFVADKKDDALSDVSIMQLEKEGYCDKTMQISNIDTNSNNYLHMHSTFKEELVSEDSFQIIDLLENMCCHDAIEDYIMYEEESQSCDLQTEKEFSGASAGVIQDKPFEACKNAKYSCEVSKNNITFNPEEEWKQILEMNKKIADFKDLLKSQEEKKINYNVHDNVGKQRKARVNLNNCKQKFLLLKEADNWLYNLDSNFETNLTSPAELIKKAFKPYLTNDNVKNWLSNE